MNYLMRIGFSFVLALTLVGPTIMQSLHQYQRHHTHEHHSPQCPDTDHFHATSTPCQICAFHLQPYPDKDYGLVLRLPCEGEVALLVPAGRHIQRDYQREYFLRGPPQPA